MPVLTVESIEAARRYLEVVLGLRVVMDHGWIVTLADPLDPSESQISLITRDATAAVNPELSVEVDDLDLAYRAAIATGAVIVHELSEEPWGVRRFFFRDDDGHVVNLLTHAPSRSTASAIPAAEVSEREDMQSSAGDPGAVPPSTLQDTATARQNSGPESGSAATADPVEQVLAAERRTLQADCRADPTCLDRFLADDFHEYGASGGSITRDGIAERVAAATWTSASPIVVENLRGAQIADGIVMVKYSATNQGRRTHRTSLWRRTDTGEWLMFHHQGTIAAG